MKRLAIITTHPIQYNAPWFKLLTLNAIVIPKVFYTWGQLQSNIKFDPGFGKAVEWDIPLLEGYQYTFVKNNASDPGSHHRNGIKNPSLINEITVWKPDAILVFGWNFKSHLDCIKYFHKKVPVIFRGDSTLLDKGNRIKALLRLVLLKWVYSYVDYALFVGTNNKNYFIEYGLKNNQLIYARHAIDNSRFEEPDKFYNVEANIIKEELGIKPNDLVLLFAGKFEAKKNPFFLINLLKKNPDPRLKVLFVGNGQLEQALSAAALCDNRIMFLPFINQLKMPTIYRLAKMVILPSTGPGETWGLSLNEAMASGVAVSASLKTGGAIDLIEDGVNGFILDLSNTSKFEKNIEEFLTNDKLLIKMGKESKNKIAEFSFSNITLAVENLLETI